MAALLVGIAIMGIVASMAIPAWRAAAKREKEAELIFRAGQVAHAIEKFRRKVGGGAYPPDLDFLVRQKYLRKKYKDPMTKDGEWRIVTPQELQAGGVGTGRPAAEPARRLDRQPRRVRIARLERLRQPSLGQSPSRSGGIGARRRARRRQAACRRAAGRLRSASTAPADAPSTWDRSPPSPARAPRSRSGSSKAAIATISGS